MFAAIRKNRELQLLLGIVLAGLGLRLFGIEHGFPFIFHPDEPAVVRSALGIRFEANPGHFDWPHLNFYLNYFLYFLFIKARGLAQVLGLRTVMAAKLPLLWQDPLVFYWLSRVFAAFLGALTAIPIFLAGRKLFDRRVGLLAALALALIPFHVHTSHFALIDVPTAFWISWGLYFSVLAYKAASWKNYALAGLFTGLAASSKYNGGLAVVTVLVAYLLSGNRLKNLKYLILAGVTSAIGFFLGTPYALLDFDTFTRSDSPVGALWQFQNVGNVDFSTHMTQLFQTLTFRFASDFGYVFLALFLIFAIYTLFKKDKRNWLILLPALFLFYYISGFDKLRSHYIMPTYPFVALSVGIILAALLEKIPQKVRWLAVVVIFSLPLYLSFQNALFLHRKDTRVVLYDWLSTNVDITDTIVYNSSSIEPVVQEISKDRSTKGISDKNLSGKKGYIIVYGSEALEGYEKVFGVSSSGRRGEEVSVYAFDKTEEI